MIDFGDFYQIIAKNRLSSWLEVLPAQLANWQKQNLDSRFTQWLNSIKHLPVITPYHIDLLHGVSVKTQTPLSTGEQQRITQLLKNMMPWRKGPFHFYGIDIDTEWRSDWKWERLIHHIDNLEGKLVLDVGCNSGYHLWRMIGAGAKLAVGIDPMALYLCQFEAVRKLLGDDKRAHLLPLGIEELPKLNAFDTVFSMGVLYHRRSPLDHLYQLKDQLVDGGQLILETLVIEGDLHQALMPGERYAQMRNVYFIPSVPTMINWLQKCGFKDVRMVDISQTSLEEQRKTDWMTSDSLADFLDPNDLSKTIEGYPAPMRAVFIAQK
ncbi:MULTISPECIES: tRNA 5-methoxyuridine(34)/uridine 5-oxyacetic acid(34) synthase CmoB [unclassified Gilliamella]|uniref:tRNA 5-methoxyuridine(34)/uridine 5-oxyacetic acid(34) synthase CmoB n=1 Tax=unclassified Gilliamella TaxID=2685620 RepID=UPI00226AC2E2|nr:MULTISPECIES: tRNA 5-methoxyuridine(34)/uridine 5-oxyacetic acid(34) synthase CmoB [unclassified Gilliamella]MCX8574822.1 tRNA 5-methoxyuridine(34)/uridine 5-oxyacetic acid(34) synthase CmoB [Gilliamella sp. B3831]MCX8577190.1 tRNA 5-methoxyuridine(34)/uridine 5-oxyacetic acid(34) synthase CmoB [Gilliamella sp. B3815]MCX8589548.1 tRNA 5-methoxyuridine(34)/uridine 5-oxyacetic acid(34) synthase CmoB [Gilliamella sp. B3812]MCX8604236.1 tRNA 5-methoxyuridine(34)/uridine 5-oxyacetic acid(34) synt